VPIDREPALWGGYAEYVYLHPDTIMHKVRNDLPAELAVMFNPLGAGVRWAADLGGTRLGDTVLVLGPGQRGISAVIAAKAAGAATVIVTGLSRDAHKLELAKEFGADHVIDVDKESTVEVVREITHGAMANVVLELTPMAAQPVRDAIEAVAFGGRIVLAGGKGGRPLEVVTDRLFAKGVTVVGAYGVDYRAYAQAINIIESGRLPLERLHTHTFGLADAALAVQTLAGETGESAMHVSISPEK
jgi:threonine dehydrogenase-like Zn-dependent dehydrogenase